MLVKELQGKRVATAFGSTAHFTLLNALANEGLSECDLNLVSMEVSDMAQALAEGRIDAFSAWEPTPTLAFADHPEFHVIHRGLSFGFLCLRRDFAAGHPAQARQLAAAVARACLWMRLPGNLNRLASWSKGSASRLQGKPYALQEAQVVDLTRRDLLTVPVAPQIPERLLREHELFWKEFEFLKKSGAIPRDTPWERIREAFDAGLLREVMSQPKRYRLEAFRYGNLEQAGGAE